MSEELRHECGIAALYWLDKPLSAPGRASQAVADGDVTPLLPGMLLDLQNRGQLAAGLSSYQPGRAQLLDTFKDVGTVAEVFRMSHPEKHRAILREYAGKAAIGHTRYATCGANDSRYAQPFERHHGRMWKWFSFAFNGNLANFAEMRDRLLGKRDYHFTLNTDTEIIMHLLAYNLRGDHAPSLPKVMTSLGRSFDGAYNIVFLDAMGRLFVARDPLGLRPLSWAVQGNLFGVASESVALSNLGFGEIQSLDPGDMAIVEDGRLRFERFAQPRKKAHCFFEWVYFSNVASTADGVSVYLTRARSGRRLAELEDQKADGDSIVVPVPDTAKAAADAFAFALGIPCVEGLIRNRYIGRTFIQPSATRGASAKSKYTALPAVLEGKRVFLIEDSIVRSTTLAALAGQILQAGRAREVHVRVACPPIVAPCFYGIDMSTLGELFAPRFLAPGYRGSPSDAMLRKMAEKLGVSSLRYLSVDDLEQCLQLPGDSLCRGCVTGKYPTRWGNRLMLHARRNHAAGKTGRTYE
ncbi:MAG TPA: amidophosphoribosyltransferase [Phycisphaerales bacterium]|nr:amidophosphoribosyltransferase [Phycisphaerales bacterium]